MKTLLSLAAAFCLAATLSAQDYLGSWIASGQTPEGETWQWKVTFKSDGTYAVDLGNDGSVDLTGKHSAAGGQFIVQDDPRDNACPGKGVYKFSVEGDQLWVEAVSDECEGRRPPGRVSLVKAK